MERQKKEFNSTGAGARDSKEVEQAKPAGTRFEPRLAKEREERDKITDAETEKFWKRIEFAKERHPDLDKLKGEASTLEAAAKALEEELLKLTGELNLAEDKVRRAESIVQRGQEKNTDDLERRVEYQKDKAREVTRLATAVQKIKGERLAARRLADEARERFLRKMQQYKSEIKKYAPRDPVELLEQYDLAKVAPGETGPTDAGAVEKAEQNKDEEILEDMRGLRQLKKTGQEERYQEARRELVNEIINAMTGGNLEEAVQGQLAGSDAWLMLDAFVDGKISSVENVLGMLKNVATRRLEAIQKRMKK